MSLMTCVTAVTCAKPLPSAWISVWFRLVVCASCSNTALASCASRAPRVLNRVMLCESARSASVWPCTPTMPRMKVSRLSPIAPMRSVCSFACLCASCVAVRASKLMRAMP